MTVNRHYVPFNRHIAQIAAIVYVALVVFAVVTR